MQGLSVERHKAGHGPRKLEVLFSQKLLLGKDRLGNTKSNANAFREDQAIPCFRSILFAEAAYG